MIRPIQTVALALLFGLLVCQPAVEAEERPAKAPPYVHVVAFYLKKDAPADAADQLIADTNRLLRKIPTVRGLWVGKPADKVTPLFADTKYHVGKLVLFDDAAGLEIYLKHPLHDQFRKKHLSKVEKVRVFDFVNKAPR